MITFKSLLKDIILIIWVCLGILCYLQFQDILFSVKIEVPNYIFF